MHHSHLPAALTAELVLGSADVHAQGLATDATRFVSVAEFGSGGDVQTANGLDAFNGQASGSFDLSDESIDFFDFASGTATQTSGFDDNGVIPGRLGLSRQRRGAVRRLHVGQQLRGAL